MEHFCTTDMNIDSFKILKTNLENICQQKLQIVKESK